MYIPHQQCVQRQQHPSQPQSFTNPLTNKTGGPQRTIKLIKNQGNTTLSFYVVTVQN
jgi:hypothetical protein